MLWIFRTIADRIKTLLITDAALGLEAEFLARQADRKAELLQKAQEYEEQGLAALAEELRTQALRLSVDKPLSSLLPAPSNLENEQPGEEIARIKGSLPARNDRSPATGLKTKKLKHTAKAKAQ